MPEFLHCPYGGVYDEETKMCTNVQCPSGYSNYMDPSLRSTIIDSIHCHGVENLMPKDGWDNLNFCWRDDYDNRDPAHSTDSGYQKLFDGPFYAGNKCASKWGNVSVGYTRDYLAEQPPPPPVGTIKLMEILGITLVVAFIANKFF